MSRTYRTIMKQVDCNCGAPIWNWGSHNENYFIRKDTAPYRECQHHFYDYYSRHNWKRDRKPWNKPDKSYKVIKKKNRKAKERAAMQKKKYDNIPFFRKEDKWDWL